MSQSNPVQSSEAEVGSLAAPKPVTPAKPKDVPPASSSIGRVKTEVPKEPEMIYKAFEPVIGDVPAIGNKDMELSLRLEGKLGYFYDRTATQSLPTPITVDMELLYNCAYDTLRSTLLRLLKLKGFTDAVDITVRVEETATELTRGLCILTYMKLRIIHMMNPNEMVKFRRQPKAVRNLMLPTPFALAISQLGLVRASSLPKEITYAPTVGKETASRFCLKVGDTWSPTAYAQAEKYAKSVGMQFSTVDLGVKIGSAWWLLEPKNEDTVLALHCPLPEDNFTEALTILRCLFWRVEHSTPTQFVDLTPLGPSRYGYMLRNPHYDINVTSYLAIEGAPETLDNGGLL